MAVRSDVFDVLSDDEEDELRAILELTQETRIFRKRPNFFEEFSDGGFKRRFRLTKGCVRYILGKIEGEIAPKCTRNRAVPADVRLLLTLRFFATGSFLLVLADFCGISETSACRFVGLVSKALAGLIGDYIKMPTSSRGIRKEQLLFYRVARFPRIIGAIDCTHVKIMNPGGEQAEVYRNRKGDFTFNVQLVVAADLRILDIVARWPGSAHDQIIFDNSRVKMRFESGEFKDGILVGDSGYQNTDYLVTPTLNPVAPEEHLYNESEIRSRNVVERCNGVLKNRFPVLRSGILLDVSKAQSVIVATAVLHNIAITVDKDASDYLHRDTNNSDEISDDDDSEDDQPEPLTNGTRLRDELINHYFLPLLNSHN